MQSKASDGIRERVQPFLEQFAEATTACLLAMVQGNLLVLTWGHWLVASRTGAVAAVATSAALALTRAERRWAVALLLGLGTTAADWIVHVGGFGPFLLEAVVTGAMAAALCFAVQALAGRPTSRRTDD
jgi:hypothetical protein